MNIIIQVIGGFGILAGFISFQFKKHNEILFFKTLNEVIFALQYFLLGAYTGMMNVFGFIRNIIFAKRVANNKSTTVGTVIFSVCFLVFGLMTYQGKKSVLIIIAKILSTVAYGNKNTTIVRGLILITTTSWLIYNYSVGSIAGVVCEAVTLVSLIIGIIRLDIVPHFSRNM